METPSSKGPDEEGYYEVVLHQFGVPEKSGRVYALDDRSLKAIADVGRRAAQGRVYAEYGMPILSELLQDSVERVRLIDESCVCASISDITLETGGGHPMVMGKVRLTGPMAEAARKAIEEAEKDTSFSIGSAFGLRGISSRNPDNTFSLIEVPTFDFVDPIPFLKKELKDV